MQPIKTAAFLTLAVFAMIVSVSGSNHARAQALATFDAEISQVEGLLSIPSIATVTQAVNILERLQQYHPAGEVSFSAGLINFRLGEAMLARSALTGSAQDRALAKAAFERAENTFTALNAGFFAGLAQNALSQL